jgi:heme/copper-type cytochrome/quinol oxidase subunit 2
MSFVYRDAGPLAAAARWGRYADALLCGAAVAVSLTRGGAALYDGELAQAFGVAQIIVTLGSLILFLIWFYRANANARAMGADGLMGSPGLSVAWFFIPIAFLFMPFLVVRDTWKASAAPRDWQGQPTPPLIGFWWAFFLASHIAGTISFRIWLEGDYDMVEAVPVFDLISYATGIAAALLGVEVIRRIQALQMSPAHLGETFR